VHSHHADPAIAELINPDRAGRDDEEERKLDDDRE
jgi:hypothetical protein